jgi:hypothetical protein
MQMEKLAHKFPRTHITYRSTQRQKARFATAKIIGLFGSFLIVLQATVLPGMARAEISCPPSHDGRKLEVALPSYGPPELQDFFHPLYNVWELEKQPRQEYPYYLNCFYDNFTKPPQVVIRLPDNFTRCVITREKPTTCDDVPIGQAEQGHKE